MIFILFNIVAFILILTVIIAIHELGHLIFAKKAKMLCYEYAIGMGPVVYKKKGQETDFSIRAFPIGGFVSIAGEQISTEMIKKGQKIGIKLEDNQVKEMILNENLASDFLMLVTDFEIYDEKQTGLFLEGIVEGETKRYPILETAIYKFAETKEMKIAPYDRCFESKGYWAKFLTLFAGPLMNFLLAFLLFFVVATFQGKPQNINTIGGVVDYLPAKLNNLAKNDKILSIGGQDVNNWNDISIAVALLTSYEDVEVVVKRNKSEVSEIIIMDLGVDITKLGIGNYSKEKVEKSVSGAVLGNVFGKSKEKLKKGDIIQAVINEKDENITINNWYDLVEVVKTFNEGELEVFYLRDGEVKQTKIHSWKNNVLESQGAPAYNVAIGITPTTKYDFVHSLVYPFQGTWDSFTQVISVLGMLFKKSEQIGINDLSGPIGILNVIGQVMRQGFLALLVFTAFLSVNIGIMNLLPIPVLDGGRILFITIEQVTRKKMSRKVENIIINIFFILMLALLLYVSLNDVIAIFK